MTKVKRQNMTAPIRKIRFAWVAIVFAVWVVLIAGRLTWLQVVRHSEWVDRAARQKIRSQKRDIPEGSEEWDLLLRRYYTEEMKKLGIDIEARARRE